MSSVFIGVAGRIQCLAIHATQVLCPSSVNAVHLLQGKHISTIYSRQDLRAVMAEQLPQWPLCCRLGACDRQGENREGAEERQGLRAAHGDGRFCSTGESSLLF